MINMPKTDISSSHAIKKYTMAICVIAAYFFLSSFLTYFNPIRLTEEINSGFYTFVLGLGDSGDVIDEYFADYSIMTLIKVVSVIWTSGLALSLVGIILAFIKRIRRISSYILFVSGFVLFVACMTSVIGAGYFNAVDSEALKGMIYVDVPMGALFGLLASGAMCVLSGWVVHQGLKEKQKASRQSGHKVGRLRQLSYDQSRPRSYAKGIGGALLGVLIGGLPWIILIAFDIFGAFFGITIGLLARFFYERMGGKDGKIKNVILFTLSILGVPIIEILGYSVQIAYFILSGEIVRKSFFELWGEIISNIITNSGPMINLLVDTGVGILFAAICCSGVFSGKKNIQPSKAD